MNRIHYCQRCKTYTLQPTCTRCMQKTIFPQPARFSPQDNYGKYRRELKKIIKG
ncbi:MAG: RNA-protein complex protein Nop10 [Candidatus Thermoplasmatota archaeon]